MNRIYSGVPKGTQIDVEKKKEVLLAFCIFVEYSYLGARSNTCHSCPRMHKLCDQINLVAGTWRFSMEDNLCRIDQSQRSNVS